MSSTNRGTIRNEADYYPTPLYSFIPLIPYIEKNKIWEPACGDGRLVKQLISNGYDADGNDLDNGYDFLKDTTKRDCIITNPPYSFAQEFCNNALSLSPQVYMLLRLNFLGSQCRYCWWKMNEPSALFVLSKRPSFRKRGGTDSTDYAWFYWGQKHKGIIHLL